MSYAAVDWSFLLPVLFNRTNSVSDVVSLFDLRFRLILKFSKEVLKCLKCFEQFAQASSSEEEDDFPLPTRISLHFP